MGSPGVKALDERYYENLIEVLIKHYRTWQASRRRPVTIPVQKFQLLLAS